ncbi:MAG: sensor histidine kinase, partial [Bryobacteraceae bacterium]
MPAHLGPLPLGPWSIPAREIVVLPLTGLNQTGSIGLLIAAVNPHRELDRNYRKFFESAAARIGLTISRARVMERETELVKHDALQEGARSSFLAYATEELRTPLTLLLAFLGKVMDSSQLSAGHRIELAGARRNALRLLKLTTALIDLGRIQTGQLSAVFEPVDLGAITADLVKAYRSAIEQTNLRLAVECPPMRESAYVDRLMWEKMVLDLLLYALQHTFEGEIGIAVRPVGGWIELGVWGTGSVPVSERPSFLDESSPGEDRVDLALIRHFAAMHGGALRLVSEEGKGSKFTVSIPRGKAHLREENIVATRAGVAAIALRAYMEEAFRLTARQRLAVDRIGSAGAAPQEAIDWGRLTIAPQARRRVVVAVPDPDLRSYCEELLSEAHTVEGAQHGEAALALVLREPTDLL